MEDKIIKQAKELLNTYPKKTNRYYLELEKSFNEFNSSDIFDTETRELYLKYIEQLNSCLVEDRYSNVLICTLGVVLCCILSLTLYTAHEYNAIAKSLDENVILSKDNVSIVVDYDNMTDFNAFTYSEDSDYKSLEPLKIKIGSQSEDKDNYTVAYLLYLVEDNNYLNPSELIDRKDFKYGLTVNNRDYGINVMTDDKVEDNHKVLIYSGSIKAGNVDNIDLRIWLNSKDFLLYKNKRYRFKLDVTGYVV